MQSVATTRMSSRGQVVIPDKIRQALGFSPGQEFVIVGERDVLILRSVKPVVMSDFDKLLARSRALAKKSGIKRSDVDRAIARVREKR